MTDTPRSLEHRQADAIAMLEQSHSDAWVATSSLAGVVHLIPMSFGWDGVHLLLVTRTASVTARNFEESRSASLAFGHTRDVLRMDAAVTDSGPVAAWPDRAAAFVCQAGWDPQASDDYTFFVLTPQQIQVWRDIAEISGRTVMRGGHWLPLT